MIRTFKAIQVTKPGKLNVVELPICGRQGKWTKL